MSRKYLFFITESFPYGRGEAFIENEFPYLLDAFDEVVVVPTSKGCSTLSCREHGKAQICPLYSLVRPKDIWTLFLSAIYWLFSSEFWHNIGKCLTYKKMLKSLWYWVPRFVFYKALAIQLTKKFRTQIPQDAEVFIYSYWLFYHSFLAVNFFPDDVRVIKRVSRAHSFDVWDESSAWRILHSYLTQHLDEVFPCSKRGEVFLQKQVEEYAGKIKTSLLGTKAIPWVEKEAKNGTNGIFRIVSCSRIDWVKRLERIIEAIELAAKQGDGLRIIWTHFGDGSMKKIIHEKAKERLTGLAVEVQWKGNVPNSEIMEFYQKEQIDLFANTSDAEGIPVAIMEALSAGIPCFATDVGGNGEAIVNGENGFLVPVEKCSERLAEVILSDKKVLSEKRRKARAFWEQYFDASKNYPKFIARLFVKE